MADNSPVLYAPDSVTHPGEMVVDYLEMNGWSQSELARRTGLTPKTISEICNQKASITPATALSLEKVFQRPAHFWLNLQRQFDEFRERQRATELHPEWSKWAKRFPIGEMQRFHWLPPSRELHDVDSLLSFFGVSSPRSWDAVWRAADVAYRQTRRFETSLEAISAWVRATELAASTISTTDFDELKLLSHIDELRQQTREPAEKFIATVQSLCAEAGVAVVWVPELPKTGISGCARWINERKALIGLTLRYKTDDEMWLTFFHEIAHILLHRKRRQFILDNAVDDLVDSIVDPQMQREEEEANRFAMDTLIPPGELADFIRHGVFTNDSVLKFSKHLGVGPGIVVGRLQRERILDPHQGNALKRIFNWQISD